MAAYPSTEQISEKGGSFHSDADLLVNLSTDANELAVASLLLDEQSEWTAGLAKQARAKAFDLLP